MKKKKLIQHVPTYRDVTMKEVEAYADAHALNIETEENIKEVKQVIFYNRLKPSDKELSVSTMRYDIECLPIAQISASQLGEDLTERLEEWATFRDTDKTLKEFMVSVDQILEMANEDEELGSDVIRQALDLHNQLKDYAYLHVTKI